MKRPKQLNRTTYYTDGGFQGGFKFSLPKLVEVDSQGLYREYRCTVCISTVQSVVDYDSIVHALKRVAARLPSDNGGE